MRAPTRADRLIRATRGLRVHVSIGVGYDDELTTGRLEAEVEPIAFPSVCGSRMTSRRLSPAGS
jgi:hypothetical protein